MKRAVMSWIYLFLAGILEACWAVGLKYTDGFTRPVASIFVGGAIAGSVVLLALAVRELPIGTAYAVWVSIGVLGAVIAQPLLFGQPLRALQVAFTILLVLSIIGLKLTSVAK
jgi:quaternary ammonium compound-resistance protein SugE